MARTIRRQETGFGVNESEGTSKERPPTGGVAYDGKNAGEAFGVAKEKVSSKGQLTIPTAVRQCFGVLPQILCEVGYVLQRKFYHDGENDAEV